MRVYTIEIVLVTNKPPSKDMGKTAMEGITIISKYTICTTFNLGTSHSFMIKNIVEVLELKTQFIDDHIPYSCVESCWGRHIFL